MIVVINAGGSGTRLWPLSTPEFPKHLLKLTDDRSLLQHTYERARRITSADKVYVVTEAGHADKLHAQIAEMPAENVIIEPARRGTGNCLVAGLERIARHGHTDEAIIFMHADHQIRDIDTFVNVVHYTGRVAQAEKRIVLLGVEPTYPAGLGYIHKGKQLAAVGEEFAYEVQEFKEKPAYEIAQEYQQSGEYLWNMGYFTATLDVFLKGMEQYGPKLFANYQALQATDADAQKYHDTYLAFDSLIIDYELMETTPNLLVVPGTFDWMDIGSFNELPEVLDRDELGNHLRGDNIEPIDIENCYVRNEEKNKTVAVIGLENIVVVNTPHGLLVTRRDLAQKVGDIAKKIQAKTS